jgi:hypothetical protein
MIEPGPLLALLARLQAQVLQLEAMVEVRDLRIEELEAQGEDSTN